MELLLEVDYRERKVKEIISENEINIQYVNLEVGDFVFRQGSERLLIIERKTISDLMSSIIDGRFRDQKERLSLTNLPVCFIIEKDSFQMNDRHRTMYRGSIINLLFKHRYNVIYSNTPKETSDILTTIYNKLKKGDICFGDNGNEQQVDFTSKSKLVADNMFVSQLCLIKGISKAIAKIIVEKYKTPKDLINAYETGIELSNLILQNGKRLGNVLSKRIYEVYVGTGSNAV